MRSAFALAFAHCLALQVAKDLQVYGHAPPPPSTLLLIAAIGSVHIAAASRHGLCFLAASGLLVLLLHGSQSNHVLLELAVALAVLLTMDSGTGISGPLLTSSMRGILIALYWSTAFAKLNDDWHDPHRSCCVHLFVGALAGWIDVAALPPGLLWPLPFVATALEIGFPLALIAALSLDHAAATRPANRSRLLHASRAARRVLTVLGAGFHVAIAVPPPPISVYPFSMLMVPIYVGALLPEEVEAATRVVANAPRVAHATALAAVAVAIAIALRLSRVYPHYEYPPYSYFSWQLGLLWNLVAFGALAGVAAAAPRLHTPTLPTPRTHGLIRTLAALLPASLIVIISAMPYLGVRTYPAFAMFSNLRIEGGGRSNHWLLPAPGSTSAEPTPYGPDRAIEIVFTDLPALRDLQVNLAPLLPAHVLHAFGAANVSREFHITPPRWTDPPTEAFRRFSVPVVEVRRRLAGAHPTWSGVLRYHDVVRGQTGRTRKEYRLRQGRRTAGSDPALDEPLPWYRALLHRYRTFDVAYSPCRH